MRLAGLTESGHVLGPVPSQIVSSVLIIATSLAASDGKYKALGCLEMEHRWQRCSGMKGSSNFILGYVSLGKRCRDIAMSRSLTVFQTQLVELSSNKAYTC